MKIKNVLTIVPSTKKNWGEMLKAKLACPPIGVCSLNSYLNLHGYNTNIIDMLIESYTKDRFMEVIKEYKPEVIMISAAYTESYNMSLAYAKVIKENFPDILIVLGGAHVTFMPEDALQHEYVDFVVMNEGECTTIELFEYINNDKKDFLYKVKGLAYKDSYGQIVINNKREYICALDMLPFANITLLKLEEYVTPFALVSSRGCPGDCIYCSSRAMSGKEYRRRSAESLITEVLWLSKYIKNNMNTIHNYISIYDDSFTVDRKRLKTFCEYMIKYNLNTIPWKCESRVDALNSEMLLLMKSAGCIAIHFGIESGDDIILKSLNKFINIEMASKAVEACYNAGIKPLCSFIIGHHLDTKETIEKTLNLMKEFKEKYGAQIACSPNTPLPGTYIYKNSKELQLNVNTTNWDDYSLMDVIISTKNLSTNDIRKYFNEYKKIISSGD